MTTREMPLCPTCQAIGSDICEASTPCGRGYCANGCNDWRVQDSDLCVHCHDEQQRELAQVAPVKDMISMLFKSRAA